MAAIQPLIAGSIVQITFRTTLFDQRIINTFQYYPVGTIDPNVEYDEYLSNLITNMQAVDGLVAKWSAVVPADIDTLVVRAQPTYPARLRYIEQTLGIVGGGTTSSTTNVAASITRKSYVMGPHGIGRIQIPISASDAVAGKIPAASPAYGPLTALAAEMLDVIPDVALAVTWIPIINTAGAVLPTQAVYQSQIQDTVRVMRRRTVRLGE